MERLTFRDECGDAYLCCDETCGGIGTPSCEDCPVPCYEAKKAYARLAAYEDTGLEPEEVKDMAENAETRLLTWCESRYGFPVGILMDLIEAKTEGRLVELPCKVGDTLYITEPRIYNYKKHEGVQQGVCKCYELDDRWGWVVKVELDEGEPHTLYFYNFSSFGKTVFLTREEAEAALKGVEGE